MPIKSRPDGVILKFLKRRTGRQSKVCFCTLAVHEAYRRRASVMIGEGRGLEWVVLTDEPGEFADLAVRAIRHVPTGPMAVDFVTKLTGTGNGRGRPAYHDKRFALLAGLEEFETAIFVDADTRIRSMPRVPRLNPGIAVVKEVNASIDEHLGRWGSHRKPVFERLAVELMGNSEVIKSARWCSEALFAITKDGNEERFFEAWERGADFLQSQGVFSGEGGVIGLAAMYAGWSVDYNSLGRLARAMRHEGGGPKTG